MGRDTALIVPPIKASILIQTPRSSLELLHERHAERLQRYLQTNAAHLSDWEPARPKDYGSLSYCAERARSAQLDFMHDKAVKLVALAGPEKQIVAVCNFTGIMRGPLQACFLGYSVAVKHEGKGLMFEVISHALPYIFDEMGMHRVMANYMPENHRSAALLERLGFKKEGFAPAYLKIAGQWRDHVLTAKINPAHVELEKAFD
ncbi:MAG: ribosomal protein S5-alanine N-acetyltransferase [Henriciella sp.]